MASILLLRFYRASSGPRIVAVNGTKSNRMLVQSTGPADRTVYAGVAANYASGVRGRSLSRTLSIVSPVEEPPSSDRRLRRHDSIVGLLPQDDLLDSIEIPGTVALAANWQPGIIKRLVIGIAAEGQAARRAIGIHLIIANAVIDNPALPAGDAALARVLDPGMH